MPKNKDELLLWYLLELLYKAGWSYSLQSESSSNTIKVSFSILVNKLGEERRKLVFKIELKYYEALECYVVSMFETGHVYVDDLLIIDPGSVFGNKALAMLGYETWNGTDEPPDDSFVVTCPMDLLRLLQEHDKIAAPINYFCILDVR